MTGINSAKLTLVTTEQTSVPVLHPLLDGAALFIDSRPADNGQEYQVAFGRFMNGQEIADALSTPLDGLVDGYDNDDIRRGLKSLTYPNSRVVRHAKYLNKTARAAIRSMHDDLAGLAAVVEHDKPYEMVPVTAHLYSDWQAELEAHTRVADMKPAAVKELCDMQGVPLDELRLWRLKGGSRENRPVNLGRIGLDHSALAQALVERDFVRKVIVESAGTEDVLIPRGELPAGAWVDDLPWVERVKLLPVLSNERHRPSGEDKNKESDISDEIANRWRINLRRWGTPVHVARPVVRWQEVARKIPPANVEIPVTELLLSGHSVRYWPSEHKVVHTSPLLGAVLLAHSIDPVNFVEPLRRLAQGHRAGYWQEEELPRRSAGLLPALLVEESAAWKLVHSEPFRALQALVLRDAT